MASEATGLIQQAINQYQPGGAFEQKELGTLLRKRSQALASAFQGQVSRGLSGTSVPMANAARFEEEVGVPVRSSIETSRTQALTNAMLQQANLLGQEQLASRETRNERQLSALNKSIVGSAGMGGGSSGGGMNISGGDGGGGSTNGGYFTMPSIGGGGGGGVSSGSVNNYPGSYGAQGSVGQAYSGIPSLQGGGTSTMPKGTGLISGPKGTFNIGGYGAEGPEAKIREWEAYIQTMKATGANPKRISIEAAQRELAYWQNELKYQGGMTG